MSGITPAFARTTSLLVGDQLLSRLRQTQRELFEAQRQISTGQKYSKPSDAPDKTSAILFLRQQLTAREQYGQNLQHSLSVLNNIDAALGEANNLLLDAKTTALSQIGVGSDAETRQTTALVIDAQLQALLDLANRQFNKISLFGGNAGAPNGELVFEEFLGGVRYTGSRDNLEADVGTLDYQQFTSNGVDAFGALSARVTSLVDLDPQATAATRIADIEGAQFEPVRKGTMSLSVDGTPVNVDLSTVDTLGDVVTRINEAINTIDPTAGGLAVTGSGFELTANAGHTITIADIGSGQTAADLGIELSSAGGVPATGPDVNVKLTRTTQLADLGTAVDWASGLLITHGEQTKVADFSTATTIEDLQNVIDELNLGLRLEINAEADGLDLVSEVSGIELSIGENGGTTAEDLGLRTFGSDTLLSEFRHGLGVQNIEGEDEFAIRLHDGTSFNVNLDGVSTVGELITTIQNAATTAGLTLGADFDVALATTGNGLVFTDNTVGANDFEIANVGLSVAADHLGIATNAGAGNTITGDDNAKVKVDSVFTHLIDLRNALEGNDEFGITVAGGKVEEDLERVARVRAMIGVQAKRVEDEQVRSKEREIAEKSMLSELQDADLTEVITRFTQLQQQLQASMQAGAQNLQLSLLDFLR